jgi:ketosteroid isomerase-like protein
MRTNRLRWVALQSVILLGLSTSVTLPALAKNAKDMVDAAASAWVKAFEAHDAVQLAAVYGDDGMLLPPNADPIQGLEAITNFWKGLIETGSAIQLDNQETFVDGKLGYRMGLYKIFAKDGAILDKGKYVEIWTRPDDKWVIHRDIWNTSLPPVGK